MRSFPKSGHLRSAAYLDWIRKHDCFFCREDKPSTPHHYPPKGMGGAQVRDDKTIPVCLRCHNRCHGICAKGELPIGTGEQEMAVHVMRSTFFDEQDQLLWEQVSRDRKAWIDGR